MSSVADEGFMKFLTSEVLCSVCERASTAKRFYCPLLEHHVCQDCVVLKFYKAEGASVGGTYPHCPECSVLLEKISSR